jgi:hypothetical protein
MLEFVNQCFITTLSWLLDTFTEFMYNANEKNISRRFQEDNVSSKETIKVFGSPQFLWVGRKGETNKSLL